MNREESTEAEDIIVQRISKRSRITRRSRKRKESREQKLATHKYNCSYKLVYLAASRRRRLRRRLSLGNNHVERKMKEKE